MGAQAAKQSQNFTVPVPVHEPVCPKKLWHWSDSERNCWTDLGQNLTSPPVLGVRMLTLDMLTRTWFYRAIWIALRGWREIPLNFLSREGVILSVGWDLTSVSDHSSFCSTIKIFCKYWLSNKSIKMKISMTGSPAILHRKFKNISKHINTFQEHKEWWKYHNNWFEGFFKNT